MSSESFPQLCGFESGKYTKDASAFEAFIW